MMIKCPSCGSPLKTIDTRLRADGVKRRTRACGKCRKTYICTVWENFARYDKDMYIEAETIEREAKKQGN